MPTTLARLLLLSMLNHGFVIEAVHGHESNITWSPRARQEDRGTGAHNMGTCPLTRLSPLIRPICLGTSRQV